MPLKSTQEILNASVSASEIRIQVGNVDANLFRVSALGVNISDVSNGDAADFRTSAIQGDAGLLRVSALGVNISDVSNSDAADFRVSAVQEGAGALMVSAKSQDGALFRTSAVQEGAGALMVSAKSQDAGLFLVSSILRAGTANIGYVSATIDNGSLSAKSSDAGTFLVSAKSIADSRAAGGTSVFSTSAGIAQLSAIKTTGGRVYGVSLFNPNVLPQYLQVFNASATSAVSLGTTVASVIYGLQASASFAEQFDPGIGLTDGITLAVTSAAGGATAGANPMIVNVFYS